MYQEILYDVDDPVATITLNRSERLNALTDRMMRELKHALADAEQNDAVVGIVLTGAGRGFCSGADMGMLREIQEAGEISAMRSDTEFSDADPGDKAMGADFESGFTYLLTIRKPIIAAINGPCAGGGMGLAMLCDMRFASQGASFTTSFAPRGLVAEFGLSWVLPRIMGSARALDILWSGRKFDGAEAVELGLVNRAVSGEDLVNEAQDYIRGLAKNSSPTSLMHMKQQVYRQLMEPLGEAMQETRGLVEDSVHRPDFKEGIHSFVERRPPDFPRLRID